MQSAHVLLVARRDPQDPIRRVLKGVGYPVISADSPSAGVKVARRSRPALIIVDRHSLGPTGLDELIAFANGQQIGLIADWRDPTGLLAEVERLLGEPGSFRRDATKLVVGPLQIDLAAHIVKIDGEHVDLTAREFDLLCHLSRHPGWVWSRQELLQQVWGYDYGDPRVVTVHVANLRKKLEAIRPGSDLIETVRNVGYRLVLPEVRDEDPSAVAGGEATPSAVAETTTTAGAEPLTDERRLVTIVFVHLTGLTALAETRGSLRQIVAALTERIVPCVERYGGSLHRLGADSAMALFGAPVAHENDAETAVRAALDIGAVVAEFEAENQRKGLSVHLGVNTGMVVAGWIEGAAADEYSVVGEAVDAAACLAELAAPGEILIGQETRRLIGKTLEAEPAGAATIRGRPAELSCYRVTNLGDVHGEKAAARVCDSVLVDRLEQLASIKGCLDRLYDDAGSVVLVTGEAGIGKSRLIAEMRREAVSRGLKWLEGKTLSYGQNMSYLPFVEILQADCGIQTQDAAPVKERRLRARIERLFADRSEEFIPVLGSLLGLGRDRPLGHQGLWPEGEISREMIVDRLVRYVGRVATEQRLVIAFEDVQWLDASSAGLIGALFPLTARVSVSLCLKGRADPGSTTLELLERARACPEVDCVEIALPPLPGGKTRELVGNLLGRADIDAAVAQAIERKSEGNPFFAEEIVRHMIDTGSLRRDEQGSWQATRAPAVATVPNTLQGVIRARIDQLPEGPRQELLRASIIGRSFFDRLLRSLASTNGADVDAHLACLRERQFLVVRRHEPELEYAFKHALVQETAYQSIVAKRRSELHRQVARVIEELYTGQIKDLYGILAYHYTQAEDWEKAQDYLLKAGDQSVTMAADAEAVARYRDAMSALLRAFDESWEKRGTADQVDWFVKRTEAFWLAHTLGDLLDSARVFYEKVAAACGPADPRTLAATTIIAGCYYQRIRYDEATRIIEEALRSLELAGIVDDPSLGRLLFLLGLCRLNTDRSSEAESLLSRALRFVRHRTPVDEGLLQDVYIALMSARYRTGQYEKLRPLAAQALRNSGPDRGQRYWTLLLNVCSMNLMFGCWNDAADQAEQCMAEITNPFMRAFAARHLGEVRHAQGVYLEAEEHLRYAVGTLEEWGHPAALAETLGYLAETELQAGKLNKAELSAKRAIRLLETAFSADHSGVATGCWTLAGVALARGELGDAERLLERSTGVALRRLSPRHPFHAELHFRRAVLKARLGQTEAAQEEFEQAVRSVAAIGSTDHPRIAQMETAWRLERSPQTSWPQP